MKKPIKKDYFSGFALDSTLVTFNSKQYAKDAEKYIEYLEKIINECRFCHKKIK